MEALMNRVKEGKVPWMSTVLRYNCLEEVRAHGIEPREPKGRSPPDKEKKVVLKGCSLGHLEKTQKHLN